MYVFPLCTAGRHFCLHIASLCCVHPEDAGDCVCICFLTKLDNYSSFKPVKLQECFPLGSEITEALCQGCRYKIDPAPCGLEIYPTGSAFSAAACHSDLMAHLVNALTAAV